MCRPTILCLMNESYAPIPGMNACSCVASPPPSSHLFLYCSCRGFYVTINCVPLPLFLHSTAVSINLPPFSTSGPCPTQIILQTTNPDLSDSRVSASELPVRRGRHGAGGAETEQTCSTVRTNSRQLVLPRDSTSAACIISYHLFTMVQKVTYRREKRNTRNANYAGRQLIVKIYRKRWSTRRDAEWKNK
ncbi:hypothetical protein J6590_005056 [Homalodisca vitripennis]|nr:hypothetical protein J6590_005056 [Homalodisca vitripennis]